MTMAAGKLVLVTQFVPPYTAGLLRGLDRALRSHGWEFEVLYGARECNRPFGDPAGWLHGFQATDLQLRRCPFVASHRDLLLPRPGVVRRLRHAAPTVLWVHERNPLSITAGLWARRHRLPVLLSSDIGDTPPEYSTTFVHRIYHRLLAGFHDGLIAMTPDAYDSRDPQRRPRVFIPHAVATADYEPPAARDWTGRLRFLFVGVLDERKGVDRLMRACSTIWQYRQDFECRFVGRGPLQSQLENLHEGWVSLAGYRTGPELRQEFELAQVAVLPSRQDTYAVVAHEAAATGLPLLLGNGMGAARVLVAEGENGFVIDPENGADLTARLEWILDHRDRLPAMGVRARDLGVQFGAEENAQRLAGWLLEHFSRQESAPENSPRSGLSIRMTR